MVSRFIVAPLSLLVAALATIASGNSSNNSNNNDNKSCDLECPRNAPCRFGHADFSGRLDAGTLGMETHRNGMHCDCPIGWTGIFCDRKYEACSNQNGHECYNGGECILGLQDKYGNDQLFCDCSRADGYVGKYCETPSEQQCGGGGGNNAFCVNGGECNPGFPEESSHPCLCGEGWEGYHCEYEKDTVPRCTLDCQNGGVCFVDGSSSSSSSSAAAGAGAQTHRWSLEKDEDRHMSCVCPSGFGGRLCEAKAEQCGNDPGHACLNGGKCVTTTIRASDGTPVRNQHHCDCTVATSEDGSDRFAGKFCEHKATSVCSGDDWNLFCTQGGTCKTNPIEGCSCRSGTAGYKCEFILDNFEANDGAVSPDDISNNSGKDECAGGYCLNGGHCLTEQIFLSDGSTEMEESCDCSRAFDATSNYAGPFCQYKSTSLCFVEGLSPQDPLEETFCVHNGVCQEDGSCDCPRGWTGQFCEVKSLEFHQTPHNDLGDGAGEEFVFEDACGDSICYNGGQCVTTKRMQSDGDWILDHSCDCSAAFDEKYLYAGESCEFPSTKICSSPTDGKGLEGRAFCTNHGTCMDDARLGCDCPPGFYGFSCEYESRDTVSNEENDNTVWEGDNENDKVKETGLEICGYGVCHNGGKCITTITYNEKTDASITDYTCDCSTAYNDDVAYLGASCEYPSTSVCVPAQSGEPLSSAHFCVNHGSCKQDPSKGCDCRNGFTGRFCQFATEPSGVDGAGAGDDDNSDSKEACGDNLVCLNGGKCILTLTAGDDGDMVETRHCDCASASAGDDTFAGTSCEYKATSLCTTPTQEFFCVNGGKCQENNTCECDTAWKGSHCELPVDPEDLFSYYDDDTDDLANDQNNTVECNMDCKNGGICAQGAKDLGSLRDTIGDVAHLNQTHAEDQFAHCVCSDGWVGLTCEHKVEVCGEGRHTCLHGSKCIPDSSSKRGYSCDCSQADDTFEGSDEKPLFDGDSCQYANTDICTIGDEDLRQPLYFCVNGGRCRAWVAAGEPDPGCICTEDYVGLHCEVNKVVAKNRASKRFYGDIVIIVMLALLGIVCVVGIGIVIRVMSKKNTATNVKNAPENNNTGSPFPRRRRRKGGFKGTPKRTSPTSIADLPTYSDDGGFPSNIDPIALDYTEGQRDGVMTDNFEDEGGLPHHDDSASISFETTSSDGENEYPDSSVV